MPERSFRKSLIILMALFTSVAAFAQPKDPAPEADAEETGGVAEAPMSPEEALAAEKKYLADMGFKDGGSQINVGKNAVVEVPPEFMSTDAAGTRKFLEETHNLPNGRELATLLHPQEGYFIIFEFDESGYVKDDDADQLDADKMLASLREGQEEGNKTLKQRGDPELEVTGWHEKPHYDPATHNLEWAPLLRNKSNNHVSVNYNVRMLGRRGVMEAQLVATQEQMATALPVLRNVLKKFEFKQGEDYASFNASTDKVAEYGLAALVTGGAVAVAAKSGLLGKLIKPLIALGAVVFAGISSFFKKLFGKRDGQA